MTFLARSAEGRRGRREREERKREREERERERERQRERERERGGEGARGPRFVGVLLGIMKNIGNLLNCSMGEQGLLSRYGWCKICAFYIFVNAS